MEANSRAYAPVLGVSEAPAIRAREAGALAAGISGTGPAIIALAERSEVEPVRDAMAEPASAVRVVPLNNIESREVVACGICPRPRASPAPSKRLRRRAT